MSLHQLTARLARLRHSMPAPPEPPEPDTGPVDEAELAALEAKLLSRVEPLGDADEEFLRLRQMLRDLAAAQTEAERTPQAIDVKTGLQAELEGKEP